MKGVLTDIESIVMWVLTIALVSHLCHFGKLSREKNTTLLLIVIQIITKTANAPDLAGCIGKLCR